MFRHTAPSSLLREMYTASSWGVNGQQWQEKTREG